MAAQSANVNNPLAEDQNDQGSSSGATPDLRTMPSFPKHDAQVYEVTWILHVKFFREHVPRLYEQIIDTAEYWPVRPLLKEEIDTPNQRSKNRSDVRLGTLPCLLDRQIAKFQVRLCMGCPCSDHSPDSHTAGSPALDYLSSEECIIQKHAGESYVNWSIQSVSAVLQTDSATFAETVDQGFPILAPYGRFSAGGDPWTFLFRVPFRCELDKRGRKTRRQGCGWVDAEFYAKILSKEGDKEDKGPVAALQRCMDLKAQHDSTHQDKKPQFRVWLKRGLLESRPNWETHSEAAIFLKPLVDYGRMIVLRPQN